MLDAYRSDVEAARARAEELESRLAARDAELATLREKNAHVEGVIERLQTLVGHRAKPPSWPPRLASAAVIAALGIVVGTVSARAREPAPAPTATVKVAPPAPEPPPAPPKPPAKARTSVDGKNALVTPNAGTGYLEVVIAEHALTCGKQWEMPGANDDHCPSTWKLRLGFAADKREVGVHHVGRGGVFAHSQAQHSISYGGPAAGAKCQRSGNSDIEGTVEVVSSTADEVVLKIDTDEFEGVVHARVCGSCQGTGQTCKSNADCCTRSCGGGTCHP